MSQPMPLAGYEVKFFLHPAAVLRPDGSPTAEAAAAFGIAAAAEEYRVLFFDGPHLDLHTERWNVRFRDKGGKVELSYKRRLPVYHETVVGVLDTAMRQGFDAREVAEKYQAEIEWGLGDEPDGGPGKRTLSITKKFDDHIDWPTTPGKARHAVETTLPGKLDRWLRPGWIGSVLERAVLFGPVQATKWHWSAADAGDKTAFEVWQVRTKDGAGMQPVVEVSFKATTGTVAEAARGRLKALIQAHSGWLAPDALKTDMVLDRYRTIPA